MKHPDGPGAVIRLRPNIRSARPADAAGPVRMATILLFTGVQYARPRPQRREPYRDEPFVEGAGRAW